MRVVVLGTGYVGLVTGVCLSEVGHDVTCVDIDEKKIAVLKSGRSPIYEHDLEDLIKKNSKEGRLNFTTNLASALYGAALVFIAVGTPEDNEGNADLSYVKAGASSIAEHMGHDLWVVVKSTVPVGTGDMVEEIIAGKILDKPFKAFVASNPEFLKEGMAVEDFMRPDRIILGLKDKDDGEAVFKELYEPFIRDDPGRLIFTDRRSSELTKYASNAMLATRISFMNEMSLLCEKLGANIDEVRRGMGSDPRIGRSFLMPGPGYGGSCFPKDVTALLNVANDHDINLRVLRGVNAANFMQVKHVTKKITKFFGNVDGKNIAVWGLTFKSGTDDIRESPAVKIVLALLARGARVKAHDPKGAYNFWEKYGAQFNLSFSDDPFEALVDAEALVLITDWPSYHRPDWEKASSLMRSKAVFDFRNLYSKSDLTGHGFHYESIGRP